MEQDKRHQDNLSDKEREEIGRKGGEATAEKFGPEHYSEIGKKGGEVSGNNPDNPGRFDNDPEKAREAGRKGGES